MSHNIDSDHAQIFVGIFSKSRTFIRFPFFQTPKMETKTKNAKYLQKIDNFFDKVSFNRDTLADIIN